MLSLWWTFTPLHGISFSILHIEWIVDILQLGLPHAVEIDETWWNMLKLKACKWDFRSHGWRHDFSLFQHVLLNVNGWTRQTPDHWQEQSLATFVFDRMLHTAALSTALGTEDFAHKPQWTSQSVCSLVQHLSACFIILRHLLFWRHLMTLRGLETRCPKQQRHGDKRRNILRNHSIMHRQYY